MRAAKLLSQLTLYLGLAISVLMLQESILKLEDTSTLHITRMLPLHLHLMLGESGGLGFWQCGTLLHHQPGDEVVWDYNVKGEEWSSCKLVGGVVKPANVKSNIKGKQKMAKECEADEDEEESEPAMSRSISRSKRRLCYCMLKAARVDPSLSLAITCHSFTR